MADFYGSPVGKSILKKFGPFMADVQSAMMKEIFQAMQKMKRERES